MKFDVTKLTDEQLEVAEKIIKEAREQGVNPDFVLPMAFVESGFNPNVPNSEAGAIGIMQLMPGTAKDMGVDPSNIEENIRGGVRYIRQLMEDKRLGGDPARIIAAYHMGPNAKFFQTNDPADIGDKTLDYVDRVNTLSGGLVAPAMSTGEEQVEESSPEAWQMPTMPAMSEETSAPQYGFDPKAMTAGAAVGAPIGAGYGIKQKIPGVLRSMGEAARGTPAVAPTPSPTPAGPRAPGGLPTAQGPAVRTPAGGQGTFNYAKQFGLADFDAARAANMSKAPGGTWDVARQVAEAEAKIGPGWKMTPDRADLLLPESAGGGPRGTPRMPVPPIQPPAAPKAPGVLSTMSARAPFLTSTLGAMGAGAQGAEAFSRYQRGDIPGAIAMGAGTLGSLLSMTPAAGVGVPMSIVGPAAAAYMDYTRNRRANPSRAPAISIPTMLMKDLKDLEVNYKANIEKGRGGPGGFSLPPMQ
jgi:hypothetical protein